MKQKVLAYILQERSGKEMLLVFDHADFPEAGTQVPAGTVDPGESPDAAVLREVAEESGVTELSMERKLGAYPWFNAARQELQERHVYLLRATGALPDRWEHIVTGGVDDKGMRFICYWMDPSEAAGALSEEQGIYLQRVIT